MRIRVIVHKAEEGGFWAEVPSIPGCATQGETMQEIEANVREAIEGSLSVGVEEARIQFLLHIAQRDAGPVGSALNAQTAYEG